ncbi:MAG TPA: HAD family hydrolase [Gemmata sp.]|jgi:phosphoglycolate phosphatase-like HAD superfamily hydrolase|nr:HAD family hydrolase [Gemmata sp.]
MTPLTTEIVNPTVRRGPFQAVLFDFDGTLSLIREGWSRLMVGMMLEHLRKQKLDREPESELWLHIERLVMAQNGAPTIRQMEVFVEEVHRRGGKPADSEVYLNDFHERLMAMVRGRWQALESGNVHSSEWAVPGVHALLGNLKKRGLKLFVASGTEYDHVSYEARLLLVNDFFPTGINAPRGNDRSFRKANVIERVLTELKIPGEQLLGFGDGMVETAEVKRVGGVAVGVASSEYGSGLGVVNAAKRAALIGAGADIIIPDYAHQEDLVAWLWGS